MSGTVVVVGAGVAGASAALVAVRAGARVVVIDGGTGASTLWTGGIDAGAPPSEDARDAADALGVVLGEAMVVATSGFVRRVRGRDAALLDLSIAAERGEVGVVRCDRPGWDADGVARAAGGGMVALDANVLRHTDERVLPDADFAERHDDFERLGWLAERLRHAVTRSHRELKALLLPPSLGVEHARAAELTRLVGLPCGEATGLPGGPAGLRYERARDRLFAAEGIEVVVARAERATATSRGWRVTTDTQPIEGDALVLCAGGLVGGGLAYQPSEALPGAALPPTARPSFRCTVDVPVRLGAHGAPLDVPGSLFGVAPESVAWPLARDPLMQRVGILCDAEGRAGPRLYAAGELVADAPRTWLAALESGALAGIAAAADAVKGRPERPSSVAEAPASRP